MLHYTLHILWHFADKGKNCLLSSISPQTCKCSRVRSFSVRTLKKKVMKILTLILASLLLGLTGCSQSNTSSKKINQPPLNEKKVGGNCEGCEAIYESPVAFEQLNETDTLPDFNGSGPQIEISGTIFKPDGKTPAPGVVLYVYHTDQAGIYPQKGNSQGWEKRHGYIRGWVKTDANGRYRLYTLVPASYPNSNNPKHIHPTVKEPGFSEYWIDEFVFEDDPLLPAAEKTRTNPVGGNGVLKTVMKDGMLRATRNITLGLNVSGYR
jgi:protocatechuate 3,4-dioxygenase beta subunit